MQNEGGLKKITSFLLVKFEITWFSVELTQGTCRKGGPLKGDKTFQTLLTAVYEKSLTQWGNKFIMYILDKSAINEEAVILDMSRVKISNPFITDLL